MLDGDLRLSVSPLDLCQGKQDAPRTLFFRRLSQKEARPIDPALSQLNLAHRRAKPGSARVYFPQQGLLRGDCQQWLGGLERAPSGICIARLLLTRHGGEREGKRLTAHLGLRMGAHGFEKDCRRGLRHSKLIERNDQSERDLRHGRVEAVTLGCDGKGRGSEEIAVILKLLLAAAGLAPDQRSKLVQQVDATDGRFLMRSRFQHCGKGGPLGLKKLAHLRLVEGRDRACDIAVTQVQRRDNHRPGLQCAPGFRSFFARRLHACLAEFVAQDDGTLDPFGCRFCGVCQRRSTRLEESPPHSHSFQSSGRGDDSAGGDGRPHPRVERLQVGSYFLAFGGRDDEQIVDGSSPPLVAPGRELSRGCNKRLDGTRPERFVHRLPDMDQVKRTGDGGDATLTHVRLEPLRCTGHLPRFDGAQPGCTLGRARRAEQEIVQCRCERLVAHLGRWRGSALPMRNGAAAARVRSAANKGQRERENRCELGYSGDHAQSRGDHLDARV